MDICVEWHSKCCIKINIFQGSLNCSAVKVHNPLRWMALTDTSCSAWYQPTNTVYRLDNYSTCQKSRLILYNSSLWWVLWSSIFVRSVDLTLWPLWSSSLRRCQENVPFSVCQWWRVFTCDTCSSLLMQLFCLWHFVTAIVETQCYFAAFVTDAPAIQQFR